MTSLGDGEIEINIDRLAGDDGRGVGEILNKKETYFLKHLIILENLNQKHPEKSIF